MIRYQRFYFRVVNSADQWFAVEFPHSVIIIIMIYLWFAHKQQHKHSAVALMAKIVSQQVEQKTKFARNTLIRNTKRNCKTVSTTV